MPQIVVVASTGSMKRLSLPGLMRWIVYRESKGRRSRKGDPAASGNLYRRISRMSADD
ncbi:hypothetical protein [Methylobacterium sp. 10]|uniref:hypothetical protein n=1 Tax=Methylobacterium sp. 10 TaxID=1101191 RepID=UPI0012DCEAFA|nr:hypothetical protein [Methylobacterium sp. 10]